MIKYASDIIDRLKKIDSSLSDLKVRVPLVMLGGASVLLGYSGKRWTKDIDILHIPELRGIGHYFRSLHIVSDVIAYLHPDYAERATKIVEMGNLDIYTLSPEDIIISKAARGEEKDFYDIYVSSLTEKTDIEKFRDLYKEAMGYWIGGIEKAKAWEDNMERAINLLRERRLFVRIFPLAESALSKIAGGLIKKTPEIDAIRFLLAETSSDRNEICGNRKEVKDNAFYLLEYAGESLADSEEEVLMAEFLRNHFRITEPEEWSVDRIDPARVNPATLFKFFKTFSVETISSLRDNLRNEMRQISTRKQKR